ncbi:hypothetical protein CRUP_032024 [Coryphaenoides rupestris]|nr:hypothetical protein CRUP_032024 [Coryphaenoides rupestris]
MTIVVQMNGGFEGNHDSQQEFQGWCSGRRGWEAFSVWLPQPQPASQPASQKLGCQPRASAALSVYLCNLTFTTLRESQPAARAEFLADDDGFRRCRSTSPPPILCGSPARCQQAVLLSDSESSERQAGYVRTDGRLLGHAASSSKTASLCGGGGGGGASAGGSASLAAAHFDPQSRLTKSKSIGCLDNRLSIYKPSTSPATQLCQQAEKEEEGEQEARSPGAHLQKQQPQRSGHLPGGGERLNGGSLSWSTQSLGPSSHQGHKRTLSLTRPVLGAPPATIRKKISEWECRRVALPRMSLCLDKRSGGECVGGSEGCPSMLSSPCSEKTFDFKGVGRRMSTAFSDCSFAEEEEGDKEASPARFQKRVGKAETSATFLRSLSARKEKSAVLNRIHKIEQALKESPGPAPPAYLNNCYALDKTKLSKSFCSTTGGGEDSDSACDGGGSKRVSICSVATEPDSFVPPSERLSKARQYRYSLCSARAPSPELSGGGSGQQSGPGTPVNPLPKPKRTFEYDAKRSQKSAATSVPVNGLPPGRDSPPPPLPSTPAPCAARGLKMDSGSPRRAQDRESCESEDAASLPCSYPSSPTENGTVTTETHSRPCSKSTLEENTYEDIVEKENPYEDVDLKRRSLVRKSCLLPEGNRAWSSMERTRTLRLRYSQLGAQPKPSSQSQRLSGAADGRKSHRSAQLSKRHSHDDMLLLAQLGAAPSAGGLLEDGLSNTGLKLVQRINAIYCTKRGKKRLKKLSMSNLETASLRDDNSESESDSDDRFKAHTQRLLKLQSILRRAPSYRTLELQLIEWQERELFEYFVVVSLKKKPTSGKGPRLPEVYCVISRLGCFDLFSKILDEVERRRGVSAALVYPFMRSLMESPFPAPGKTIRVKTFLPGAGNEVIELRRPMDSRLEHVDFDSLFSCLSVRQVIRVFASLLLERRVIFVADKLSVQCVGGTGEEEAEEEEEEGLTLCPMLRRATTAAAAAARFPRCRHSEEEPRLQAWSTLSSCIHAVVALLYPFSWQHTFIPVLPAAMVDIALMVDLGTDRFIRQMDDEASLLPRKLQSALEQALEQRNDIINLDSDSESDEEVNSLNSLVSEAFIRERGGERLFQRQAFRKSVASKSIRRFLGVFMESQMFAGFIQDRERRKCRAKGLFEQRVEQYLEELPDTEQSGVNKFLKGLGNKMKFLHKKN